MTIVRHTPRPRPNRGAVKCWCSPEGGWSYVQTIGERSVTVLDTWAGGAPVTRAIPTGKMLARMTAAELTAARKAGRVRDTSDGTGFYLTQSP